MNQWQLQTAKARISELVKKAQRQPQEITLHGKAVVVVLSRLEYERLSRQHQSLAEFIRHSPLYGLEDMDFSRDKSPVREVNL